AARFRSCILEHVPRCHRRGPSGKLRAAVTALYKPPPEVAEGFLPEDYWEDPIEVWPENWEGLMVYTTVETQWNWATGLGGGARTGLRSEAAYPLLDRMTKCDEEAWERLFSDIQCMEQAALAAQHLKQ